MIVVIVANEYRINAREILNLACRPAKSFGANPLIRRSPIRENRIDYKVDFISKVDDSCRMTDPSIFYFSLFSLEVGFLHREIYLKLFFVFWNALIGLIHFHFEELKTGDSRVLIYESSFYFIKSKIISYSPHPALYHRCRQIVLEFIILNWHDLFFCQAILSEILFFVIHLKLFITLDLEQENKNTQIILQKKESLLFSYNCSDLLCQHQAFLIPKFFITLKHIKLNSQL